jgi:hypothetical protein
VKREAPRYASEAALCEAFTAEARAEGWTVYPETSGWDLLLVRDTDGAQEQIGVEAKLRCNLDVVAQALTPAEQLAGPDRHTILVPKTSGSLVFLAAALGLGVACMASIARQHEMDAYYRNHRMQRLPIRLWMRPGRLWAHPQHAWLPPVVPDGAAGVPSPRVLSRWKVQAIRLCLRLESQGSVTTEDFDELGINHRRWVDLGWIADSGRRDGRRTIYVAGKHSGVPLPTEQHPSATAQMRAQGAA